MALFPKTDGECAGRALGVVCARIPEDVRMQSRIDYPLRVQRRSHRFLNQSSPPPYEILHGEELLLGGQLMLIRRMTSVS